MLPPNCPFESLIKKVCSWSFSDTRKAKTESRLRLCDVVTHPESETKPEQTHKSRNQICAGCAHFNSVHGYETSLLPARAIGISMQLKTSLFI